MQLTATFRRALGLALILAAQSLRNFHSWSDRSQCQMARNPNYPFAYSKYLGQTIERKGRVNTNKQDFRHSCQTRGGRSKCYICEDIICRSDSGNCSLQLQGVSDVDMSVNIPTVSDTAWPVNGRNRHDFGGNDVTHICTFLSGGNCTLPSNEDFEDCVVRCFGYGFNGPSIPKPVPTASIRDVYPIMNSLWPGSYLVDYWQYPSNCEDLLQFNESCVFKSNNDSFQLKVIPDYNPQGYTFTVAGSGEPGFKDGHILSAQFNMPQNLALDDNGNIYVADTLNNAIRVITTDGYVKTLAGGRTRGYREGNCSLALFTEPKDLDVRLDQNGEHIVIVVADTGNHRIRQIDYYLNTSSCVVSCLSGLCGNNSLSATLFRTKASPYSGFADGPGLIARFSAPEGVAFLEDNSIVVADTGNFLIRYLQPNGNTSTLAGSVGNGPADADGNPLPGCPPPCLEGIQGFRDGNLSYAQFYNPLSVTRGPNNTVWVTDEHRIRLIEFPFVNTNYYTISSSGRVSTIAGSGEHGNEDGLGPQSSFFDPSGIFVTSENTVYVTDSATCLIRRISPLALTAQEITCQTRAVELVRPSGCTSFDAPVDKIGRKISRVEANIVFNSVSSNVDKGKYIKNCVGSPPFDRLDKRFVNISGDNLVIDDGYVTVDEDSEEGMAIIVHCPSKCFLSRTSVIVEGTGWYGERSSVCLSAIHSGILSNAGGYIRLTYQRHDFLDSLNRSVSLGSFRNGIQSIPISEASHRIFSIESVIQSMAIVHTVGGHPRAPLESGCGYGDGQPATKAFFNKPSGIAGKYRGNLDSTSFLYIADTANHRIRAISPVCTFACENRGRCVGNGKCLCREGWEGIDCTIPICNSTASINKVCTSPNTFTCKPGYSGPNCDIPTCIQHCANNGTCIAPDTCRCSSGWFDANCTTPVCPKTCGNGGNCTAPNQCSCPSQWTGDDCRIPVCVQTCINGACVAPNTCACSPQYFGYDCSLPVCHQGFFIPAKDFTLSYKIPSIQSWPTYKYCDLATWCNYTNEFECDQKQMTYDSIQVPSGPLYRAITGLKSPPLQCNNIELQASYKLPFQLLNSDNTSTNYRRYSNVNPYESNSLNPWRGYLSPTLGHTGPWTYEADREIAVVSWFNVSQGVYVCANEGQCISPDVCRCAEGWIGFDCRTPVCQSGYYHPNQMEYVSGQMTTDEVQLFEPYLGNNSYRLNWPYSNPNYTIDYEIFVDRNASNVQRKIIEVKGKRYQLLVVENDTTLSGHYQGGYRCSIRSVTQWENLTYLFSHPNYYSRYMDLKKQRDGIVYTYWENMRWPPVYEKSEVLDRFFNNLTYVFTNEGYRRNGIWNRTSNAWEYGLCIIEFYRNCSGDPSKAVDLESFLIGIEVQDTDLSYRPRIRYDDERVYSMGRWKQEGGNCVDNVIRGCYNNGTCIAPNVCRCAEGWSGEFCTVPICNFNCRHHGNCTFPNTCTCERGWSGSNCTIPLCAQECQNGGVCIAPDTCKCQQWPNSFVDGRADSVRPLFQDSNGDALLTGWTGYDCGVPICVQAETFELNVASTNSPNFVSLGGHGPDGTQECLSSTTHLQLPRCPNYDVEVSSNIGLDFQSGCGYDPYDTGCCVLYGANQVICYSCPSTNILITNHTYQCTAPFNTITGFVTERDKFVNFYDSNQNLRECGRYQGPRYHNPIVVPQDYGVAEYYKDASSELNSNRNYLSTQISNRYLCGVRQWIQGDYIDDAGLGNITGAGSIYGLDRGRSVRINYPNVYQDLATAVWRRGSRVRGEGVYACYNGGSCIGPDVCTCRDGYTGYDCQTPLCRHQQPSRAVTSCLNGGVCISKDNCQCIQIQSVSYLVHKGAKHGITGWTGSDCSMPMCSQGYFDPFCTDLPQAPGGEGCYRCQNGGNCTAPDICTCAPGWTGFDCSQPTCEVVADHITRTQLGTVYEDKVIAFESDPCGVEAIYGLHGWRGRKYARGNCTRPNTCTCLCKIPYSRKSCAKTRKLCDGPWQDPLSYLRDILAQRGPEFTFGSTNCAYGYEGGVNSLDEFTSCHQTIFYPSQAERWSLYLVVICSGVGFLLVILYYFLRKRLKANYLRLRVAARRVGANANSSQYEAVANNESESEGIQLLARQESEADEELR